MSSQKLPSVWPDIGRALILIAGFVALSGIALVLLPQSAVDVMIVRIENHHNGGDHEKISLVYLVDEFTNGAFRIRGVIRNITDAPTERIDAVVRLYGMERALLETVIVRLDKEIIEPNDFARFDLTVPEQTAGFVGYAVEFKLREGDVIHHKDMRRQGSQNPYQ